MNQKMISVTYACLSLTMAISIIYFPHAVLDASRRGLDMWATVVFPSLLPFFIVAELLIGFGVVHFVGVLCEPIMRPLFNVPGVGGFVWSMGMASGYPSGAKLTARLRQEDQLTKIEAERLLTFTNASNPLFIIGAVSIGFFHDQKLGILLAITHYLGNFFVGLCMRFYKYNERSRSSHSFSIIRALHKLHEARMKDKRPFGKILGDAVTQSIQTLLLIGGFIMLFSVITRLIQEMKLSNLIAHVIGQFLQLFQLPKEMASPLFTGMFEITLGANEVAHQDETSILVQAVVVAFILAFNGFSVQAQVASIIAETDIRFAPYFFGRILHGLIACLLTILLFKLIYPVHKPLPAEIPVWYQQSVNQIEQSMQFFNQFGPWLTISALFVYLLLYLRHKT
ncbi:sporulation integral membrane protein YlbJ [Gracilibacillus halophilus YIM-C55.5]|uniref:Sporulation integral membrane protein YlbJ n=1 Tax=Gracilibacillus halophilus YIM-C55.5 TaxID=1308866 RepID=N4WVD2_9BACI|nr:sporulation integral membrane protein YlbJ [Gracilibacillus halophilus]ENH98345.1 sporulation integral membrane protein YlbJ [Gracilibacillus halophilus YIM-C55.5]